MAGIGLFFSCSATKKAARQASLPAGSYITVTPKTKSAELDSLKTVLTALNSSAISDFTTLKAKVKMDYEGDNQSINATANIRMKKDSLIWISVTGLLSVEGARLMVTPDSVILMNKLKHNVVRRPIAYLATIAHLPISFSDMQDIILGNPLFTGGKIKGYQHQGTSWSADIENELFNSFVQLMQAPEAISMTRNTLKQQDQKVTRSCDLVYKDYQVFTGLRLATDRKITLEDQKKINIELQFKEVNFNQPLTFPFSIPKNYKQL